MINFNAKANLTIRMLMLIDCNIYENGPNDIAIQHPVLARPSEWYGPWFKQHAKVIQKDASCYGRTSRKPTGNRVSSFANELR